MKIPASNIAGTENLTRYPSRELYRTVSSILFFYTEYKYRLKLMILQMSSQTMVLPVKRPVVIKLETNYNGKLANQCMIHIDRAPTSPLPERSLNELEVIIETRDNSYKPTRWELVDLVRLPVCNVTTLMTWQSHGIGYFEFAQLILSKFCSSDTHFPVAIYFYRRLSFED